jgi:hypothetical protein
MDYPTGIYAVVEIEQDGAPVSLEVALGPSDSMGNLEDVIERFVQAYCLSVNADAFTIDEMRICIFDPERLLVAFDEDDQGRPSEAAAMSNRFAFGFIGQLEEEPTMLDPWLVVRPCTKQQVQIWYQLLMMTGPKAIESYCLDPQLSGFFQAGD